MRSATPVETTCFPELRKEPRPQRGYAHSTDAAYGDGRDGADQRGHGSRPKFAELVRGSNEHAIHCTDPTAHPVRGPELDQCAADIDADHVGGSEKGKRDD